MDGRIHKLSRTAKNVVNLMGNNWMRILVPKEASKRPCRLVTDPRFLDTCSTFNPSERFVDRAVVEELISKHMIGALTENGDKHKIGWRTIGVDGINNDVYVLIQ
jgi:hypothetical protein